MIPSLHITKIEPEHYQGTVVLAGEELDEAHAASIGALIQHAAQMPGVHAMHVWYEDVCGGTKLTGYMRDWPELLAQDLVDLKRAVAIG